MRRTWRWLTLPLIILTLLPLSSVEAAHPKVFERPGPQAVPEHWIVVLQDNQTEVDRVTADLAGRANGSVEHRYTAALKGFSLHASREAMERIAGDARVLFIEQDARVDLIPPLESLGPVSDHGKAGSAGSGTSSQTVPTGVDRVNAELNPNEGAGVGVAVIDTGIQLDHPDLKVAGNVTFVTGTKNGNDDNGHGTHVAGTIAGLKNTVGTLGVASASSLYAVKVLNKQGSGFTSGIVKGIDWVTANANKIAVANMSLGGSGADDGNCGNTNGDSIHKAICKSVDAGIVYVVAAGNSAADAKTFMPAAYDEVVTVSALADSDGQPSGTGPATSYGKDDTFATFSNYGADVDVIAPGVNIFSTWKGSSYNTISGTSMATPHVTGAVALWIATNGRPVDPSTGKVTGNMKSPAVQAALAAITESVGKFPGDKDTIAEPMLNANTTAAGGTGGSVGGPAP